MIDRHALLATLKPLVSELEDSIRVRAVETADVAEHLKHEHHRAVVAERTAMSLEEWRDGEITQAAVAWVLGCVFVRFLEDNGLVDQALISGPGDRRAAALGHREEHFRTHPAHSDREYLEACFHEVANYPAVAPLYDTTHNPLWRLGPAADGARTLRETFIALDPDSGNLVHDFTDPELDTRFLGDLYQDMSESAQKRYALLQTPEFIEHFILDRTLSPAIEEFGLTEVRLIDPTCGSGHFLIGAFHRLFALWQAREPATTSAVIAQRSLDQVSGVDLNPYATAVARFRLVVAALRVCGITRLDEAPALRLHLATGDSLLHGPLPDDGATMLFDANRLRQNIAHVYEAEDAAQLKEILGRGYHAVVGNPPYIVGEDDALRAAYRARYASCHREFALSVPFMERFFELGRVVDTSGTKRAGFIGKITGNNFMKREFGAPLVEKFLPSVDVATIVDTSGVYLPGHGTPTVMVFARSRPPSSTTVRVVDSLRGESRRPLNPSAAPVWIAVTEHIDHPGQESEYVRVSDVERSELAHHPLIVGAGRIFKKRIDALAQRRVHNVAADLGYTGQTNIDDLMLRPRDAWRRAGVAGDLLKDFVTGHDVRDWEITTEIAAWFPYSDAGLDDLDQRSEITRPLWPWRTSAWARRTFGKQSYKEEGRRWYEWHQTSLKRHQTPLAIAWASVATHNHFALSRGDQVFNKHSPIIKLSASASDADYLQLLELLNSSLAAAWLRQVCHNRGAGGVNEGFRGEDWEFFIEISVGRVADLPIARTSSGDLARELDSLSTRRSALLAELPQAGLTGALADRCVTDQALLMRMIALQEELDWRALADFGLVPEALALGNDVPGISLGERAFEIALAQSVASGRSQSTWFERHGTSPTAEVPTTWPMPYREVVQKRVELLTSDVDVGFVERPEHKRRWAGAPWHQRQTETLVGLILDALEARELWLDLRPRSTNELADALRQRPLIVEALDLVSDVKDVDIATTLRRLVLEAAVPHLAAQRLTDKGLRKREVWEQVWELQRVEDCGDAVATIPVPPKYGQVDFRSATYWKLRGKLDVPKERFTLIPNAERGADTSPVVGWAGWDQRDLARALAGRVTELRQDHAADAQRLVPLLAGVLELLPWISQWHPGSDPLFGGPPGAFFESWLDGELAALGVTRDTLRAWRPPAPTRGRKAKATTT